jgi:monoamine oxidase
MKTQIQTANPKVLILGAGAAGLAAALKLNETGHSVRLLEARTRPGGRIYTLREPFSDGQVAEAGAGRIPDTHKLTLQYVRRFGLTLDPFWPQTGMDVFLWRGVRQIIPRGESPDPDRLKVQFTSRERAAGFRGLWKLYLDEAGGEIGSLPDDGWPFPGFAGYKDVTLGEYLRGRGASADARAYLAQGFEDDSLLDFIHDEISRAVPAMWKIRGGNDLLPQAMAQSLGECISYGAEVRRIAQEGGGVVVTYFAEGALHTARADRVICTIPFPVLRGIMVEPGWSRAKAAAIGGLYSSPVARVFMQTRRRLWEERGMHGFATVDLPLEVWSPTHNQSGAGGILMSYIYERLAVEYSAQPPQAQIGRTVELFDQLHPGVRADCRTAATWSWLNEPYSQGAFTITKSGGFPLLNHVAAPEGRIHFAGEHASPWPCWIQGALHSGLRAAQEVTDAG